MQSIRRSIGDDKPTAFMLGFLGIAIAVIALVFAALPAEASVVKTVNATVEYKDAYLRLSMFVPMGDNVAGIPLLEVVYTVKTSSGEEVQVTQQQYNALKLGDQIVINYWVRGWLDGKSLAGQ